MEKSVTFDLEEYKTPKKSQELKKSTNKKGTPIVTKKTKIIRKHVEETLKRMKEEEDQEDVENQEPEIKKSKIIASQETAAQRKLRETIGKRVETAAQASKKMLGFHVSAANGLQNAIYNARSEGCRSFAMFVRNQRTWNHKPMDEKIVENWRNAIIETSFDLGMIVPHGSYLINCGSPEEEKLEKSRNAILDECQRAERLGLKLYNFHPGSSVGKCEKAKFLETMAGQGNSIGGTFEELQEIIEKVDGKYRNRVGVCIDTCHIFAAGYDIRSEEKYEETMKRFGEVIGFERLKAIHVNDSLGDLGSNLDRHAHIGEGKIGKKAFEFLMRDERLNGIPMILETPEGKYADEMCLMYSME
ncbi:unnamed protein product [Caenorhabditis angaria]|uniref:Xylose isomerase-like TIM barrel domain-containing protein n=1 Tax=Caenorhabditis angaria TaxID=860376 RepID=A0A9P1IAQ0_9PELO|nr:unnamed protein product [Caenorhabditis angaria]